MGPWPEALESRRMSGGLHILAQGNALVVLHIFRISPISSRSLPFRIGCAEQGLSKWGLCHSELAEESPAPPRGLRSLGKLGMTDRAIFACPMMPHGANIGMLKRCVE